MIRTAVAILAILASTATSKKIIDDNIISDSGVGRTFDGYYRYENSSPDDPMGSYLPIGESTCQTECDSRQDCYIYSWLPKDEYGHCYLITYTYDTSISFYPKESMCSSSNEGYIVNGTGGSQYRACDGMKQLTVAYEKDYTHKYEIPPDLCEQECSKDDTCAVMAITSDGNTCYLLSWPARDYTSYLKVAWSTNGNVTNGSQTHDVSYQSCASVSSDDEATCLGIQGDFPTYYHECYYCKTTGECHDLDDFGKCTESDCLTCRDGVEGCVVHCP